MGDLATPAIWDLVRLDEFCNYPLTSHIPPTYPHYRVWAHPWSARFGPPNREKVLKYRELIDRGMVKRLKCGKVGLSGTQSTKEGGAPL